MEDEQAILVILQELHLHMNVRLVTDSDSAITHEGLIGKFVWVYLHDNAM